LVVRSAQTSYVTGSEARPKIYGHPIAGFALHAARNAIQYLREAQDRSRNRGEGSGQLANRIS
jgi:hypothetical protein